MKYVSLLLSLCLLLCCPPAMATELPASLHTLQGKTLALDSFKGKWLMIHYWASWCDACVSEITTLNTFYQKNKQNVALFAVNLDEVSPADQQKLSDQYHLSFPSLVQGNTPPFDGDNITALPATMVFDPQGHFQGLHYGMQSLHSLHTFIANREHS